MDENQKFIVKIAFYFILMGTMSSCLFNQHLTKYSPTPE